MTVLVALTVTVVTVTAIAATQHLLYNKCSTDFVVVGIGVAYNGIKLNAKIWVFSQTW